MKDQIFFTDNNPLTPIPISGMESIFPATPAGPDNFIRQCDAGDV